MSGYLYNLVGNVLKYFKEKRAFLTNEQCLKRCTPPRGNQRKIEISEDRDVWMTPDCHSKRHNKSGMGDSRMLYSLSGAGDYTYPMDFNNWSEFPDESSDSLRLLVPPPTRRATKSCLKRSYSAELHPPPLFQRHRTNEWKAVYDNIFQTQTTAVVEEPKRSLSSRIPQQSFRAADDCQRSAALLPKSRCTCSRRNAERQEVARRSQLNALLERMFRMVSKSKYCGNIIDAASHARWMKLAGVTQDEDAAHFKKFAKGRVVLTVSQYKSALQKMCEDHHLDYWNVLSRMTDVSMGGCDSNSHVSAQSLT